MEDTFCIHDGGRFAGVFDGHGGAGVSKYTSKTIYDKINKFKAELESTPTSTPSLATIVKSIGYAFEELDNDVLSVDELQYQGSTAVTVYVHEDSQTRERTIVSANIGDSRAILSRGYVAVDLTRDHKPDDEHEKERILAMGETIEWDSYCQVSRVKNLSLSRALGDRFAKPVVSGEAEIQLFHLDEIPTTHGGEDDCIILASDGLWDVMTSQDCVDFVKKRLTPSEAQTRNMSKGELLRQKISRRKNMSRIVANEATRRGSYDNVCVVIIWLDEPNGTLRD
jgi:serine/threonine protein phosphatase PrpC